MADTRRLSSIDRQMEELKKKRRQEQQRIKTQERKEEQRRRMLIGSIVTEHADNVLKAMVDKLLTEHVAEGDKILWPRLWPDLFPDVPEQNQDTADTPASHGQQLLETLKKTARRDPQTDEEGGEGNDGPMVN